MHTNTKPQIPSTRGRSLGWRMHGSVEDTKLSTNKQHSLSLRRCPDSVGCEAREDRRRRRRCSAPLSRPGNADHHGPTYATGVHSTQSVNTGGALAANKSARAMLGPPDTALLHVCGPPRPGVANRPSSGACCVGSMVIQY